MHVHTQMCTPIHLSNFLPLPAPWPKARLLVTRTMTVSVALQSLLCAFHTGYTQENAGKKIGRSQCYHCLSKVLLFSVISSCASYSGVTIHRPCALECLRDALSYFIQASECLLIKEAWPPPISLCPLTLPCFHSTYQPCHIVYFFVDSHSTRKSDLMYS